MRGNFNGMMAQVAKMQQNIKRMQSELGKVEVTGEAGGGLVKVTMTCKYECKQIEINPSLYEEDRDMIEDLVTAAVNSALKAVEAETQARMRQATAGMPLPPGMF